jgi:putative transposase
MSPPSAKSCRASSTAKADTSTIALEVSHQPTRRRERQMKRFKSARHAQRFLSSHSRIHNHFQLRRHHLNASQYRAARNAAFGTWHDVAEVAPAA